MGKRAEKPAQKGPRKQHIWLIILGNLLLMLLLCVVAGFGAIYYTVNMLQNKLLETASTMTDYTAVVDECLKEGRTRAAQYADILVESCYSGASSATLPVMLQALGALEPENDVGVVDPYGVTTSTRGLISDARNETFFTDTLLGIGGVYAYRSGETSGILFTAPLTTASGNAGILYIVDVDGLTIPKSARMTLSDASKFCIVDENNALISYVGARPEGFDYDEIASSGLLFSPTHAVDLVQLIREGRVRLGSALASAPANSDAGTNLLEVLNRTYPSVSVWFENGLAENGWKTVSFARRQLDALSMRELIAILILTALIICIPIVTSVSRTITQIVNNRRIAKALLYDPVTGGNNFSHFKQTAEKLMKKARYNGRVFAVVSLDIVKFRVFSDVHGHEAGEALLLSIFRHLQGQLRRGELIARYTVDQFALLLILDPKEDPVMRAERLTHGIDKLYPGEKIRCSTGVYAVTDRGQSIERMYRFATVAKDVARASVTGAPVMLFNTSMRKALLHEQQLEALMEKALKNHEFVVYLQPKYSVGTHRLAGAEALVRWQSPERGFISPGDFIPVFEKNGFIVRLDDYVLSETCRIQQTFLKRGRALVPVSVNISRAHFADANVAQHIKDIVDAYGVPHDMIELEMTESAFFDDKLVLLNTVKQLRKLGFAVSMDDFGSGYSSLNSLKDLPLDVVKLDKAFFDTASDVDRGVTLIRDTIRMAKNLSMQVVAEGIETVEQVEFLSETGCDLIQGFYFAKPMPVEEFEKLEIQFIGNAGE